MILIATRTAPRPEVCSNDLDGVVEFQDLYGQAQVNGNPLDYDLLNPEDPDDFVNASGKGLFAGIRARKAQRQQRRDLRTKSKAQARLIKAGAKQTKANAKIGEANAKTQAAISAGKDDGTAAALSAALKPSKTTTSTPHTGMSNGAKVGIGLGIALVLGVTGFLIYRHTHKGKGK